MAVHNANRGTFKPQKQVTQATRIVAPVKGVDATTILSNGDPLNSIYAFNLLPSEFGMQVRKGYREWAIGVSDGNPLGIGTIIPYGGEDVDKANDRLFVVSNEGIWDVTTAAAVPNLVLDFSLVPNGQDTTAAAGYGNYAKFRTDSGANILFYADSANGLFRYTESSDTWIREATIAGIGPPALVVEDINFVMVHKEQLWFSEKDKSYAWFLPAGSISGDSTIFFLGAKFYKGSNVAGMFSWTIDGGAGVDDILVFVSRAGDVIPYQGNDPSMADSWQQTGQWFIGAIPAGPNFGTQDGGNLYLLSVYGLTSMDEIIVGVDGKNLAAENETKKISPVIRSAMEASRDLNGWSVKLLPSQSTLLISEPQRINGSYIQYARNTTTEGWGFWRSVPINAFDEWIGNTYFGIKNDSDKVYVMDVNVDNALITPVAEQNGVDIQFSILTTFQDWGSPAQFKRPKYCRPQFVSTERPASTTSYRFDYDLSEVLNTDSTPLQGVSGWDVSLWDIGTWDTSDPFGISPACGAWGMGRAIAIGMSGRSRTETTFISWDVQWDVGSPM